MSDDLVLVAVRHWDDDYLISRDHSKSGSGFWWKVFLPESLIARVERAEDEYAAAQAELEAHLDQPPIPDRDSLDVEQLKAEFLARKGRVPA